MIEPGPLLADACRSRGLKVIEKFLENVDSTDLPESPKAFVSFELFEHLYDPESFHAFTQPDEIRRFIYLHYAFGNGVDIQILWEHSRSSILRITLISSIQTPSNCFLKDVVLQ